MNWAQTADHKKNVPIIIVMRSRVGRGKLVFEKMYTTKSLVFGTFIPYVSATPNFAKKSQDWWNIFLE